MTGAQRREQLLAVSRKLFAEKGFEGTSVEEIAARAEVSKPVVYEHFGGKEGIYAVVVDREIQALLGALTGALEAGGHPQVLLERTAMALLDYIESSTDGFRILVRDSPVAQSTGTFSSLIGDIAMQVEHLLADQFSRRGLDARVAPIYAQMLVGMVALPGQYWLDARKPRKDEVAAHLVNLAWNGLVGLQRKPTLRGEQPRRVEDAGTAAGGSKGEKPAERAQKPDRATVRAERAAAKAASRAKPAAEARPDPEAATEPVEDGTGAPVPGPGATAALALEETS
jgi:AcrR family transcriptional regulator